MYSQLEQIALSDFGDVVIHEFLTFVRGKLAEYGV
jgi:hypothetical protein